MGIFVSGQIFHTVMCTGDTFNESAPILSISSGYPVYSLVGGGHRSLYASVGLRVIARGEGFFDVYPVTYSSVEGGGELGPVVGVQLSDCTIAAYYLVYDLGNSRCSYGAHRE